VAPSCCPTPQQGSLRDISHDKLSRQAGFGESRQYPDRSVGIRALPGLAPALVPKLRFPEFRGAAGWKPVTLQEASTPVTERVGERKLTPVSISAGIGFVPQAEKLGRDISGNQYQLYTLVRDGNFVFNKGNSLKFPQGCVYLLQAPASPHSPSFRSGRHPAPPWLRLVTTRLFSCSDLFTGLL
jgi:hypothetical protein